MSRSTDPDAPLTTAAAARAAVLARSRSEYTARLADARLFRSLLMKRVAELERARLIVGRELALDRRAGRDFCVRRGTKRLYEIARERAEVGAMLDELAQVLSRLGRKRARLSRRLRSLQRAGGPLTLRP
jgi:hypothetical protein